MECPFELPVHKEDWMIIDILGYLVVTVEHLDEADYIVQAINSHEKLVKALQYLVADHPAGLLPDKPKSLLQAVEALEAEKKK